MTNAQTPLHKFPRNFSVDDSRNPELDVVINVYNDVDFIFSARQHICYSALYAIARPSVCLSVRPSVTRVDQSKTVEVRITDHAIFTRVAS